MANRISERAEFDENVDLGDHDELLRYQAGILGHSMTEMKAFFTSGFNTLKIRSIVLRLAFRISVKKVVHCSVISYK